MIIIIHHEQAELIPSMKGFINILKLIITIHLNKLNMKNFINIYTRII